MNYLQKIVVPVTAIVAVLVGIGFGILYQNWAILGGMAILMVIVGLGMAFGIWAFIGLFALFFVVVTFGIWGLIDSILVQMIPRVIYLDPNIETARWAYDKYALKWELVIPFAVFYLFFEVALLLTSPWIRDHLVITLAGGVVLALVLTLTPWYNAAEETGNLVFVIGAFGDMFYWFYANLVGIILNGLTSMSRWRVSTSVVSALSSTISVISLPIMVQMIAGHIVSVSSLTMTDFYVLYLGGGIAYSMIVGTFINMIKKHAEQ